MVESKPVRKQLQAKGGVSVGEMRSVPGAVATGSQPGQDSLEKVVTRSLPLPVLTP